MFRALLAAIVLSLSPSGASAGDTVWSALVLATNVSAPEPAPKELARFTGRLKKFFGYNQFQLIGSHTERINDPAEHWLIPSKRFCLRVQSVERDREDKHLVSLLLYQDRKLLLETRAQLGEESPLFIRGPLYSNGQLIIVLAVK